MDAEDNGGVASFLVREEGDQCLQLGGSEHLSEHRGHHPRELLVTFRRVAARVENLLTDRRCIAAAADVVPRRPERGTFPVELVTAATPLFGVQLYRVQRGRHRRPGGGRGCPARGCRRGLLYIVGGDVDLTAL